MKTLFMLILILPMLVCVYLKNGQKLKWACHSWEIINPTTSQLLGGADVEGSSYIAIYDNPIRGVFGPTQEIIAVIPLSEVLYVRDGKCQ